MSAKNNVNKDHYTQAGRDRANENIVHDDHKEAMTQAEKRIATGEAALPRGQRAPRRDEAPLVLGADHAQLPPLDSEPAEGLKEREVGGDEA
jgi:hypothetical protein